MEYAALPPSELRLGERVVAEYVAVPKVDPKHGPRPFLHPVRTLGGVVTTDVLPEDHRWHQGVSVALQDVDGTNLWGGRTYVRGQGYTWLDDHGRIENVKLAKRDHDAVAVVNEWKDRAGRLLLTERQLIHVSGLDERAWLMDVTYSLETDRPVTLGSPATNGRPDNAGYGGFFWRGAPRPSVVFNGETDDEELVNGSATPWAALATDESTVVLTGLSGDDRWFARAAQYPGLCVAFAFEKTEVIDGIRNRRHRIVVADGRLTTAEAQRYADAALDV